MVLSARKKKKKEEFFPQSKWNNLLATITAVADLQISGFLIICSLTLNPAHSNSDEILNLKKNQSTHNDFLKYDGQVEHNLHSQFNYYLIPLTKITGRILPQSSIH